MGEKRFQPSQSISADNEPFCVMEADDVTLGTINLDSLFSQDLSSTGTFDLRGVRATTLGKLLQAIPIPAMLVNHLGNIAFLNRSCKKVSNEYLSILGKPFVSLFPHQTPGRRAQELMNRALSAGKQVVSQALLRVANSTLWGRINLRAVRIGEHKAILVLLEDLTLEKRQLLLDKRHREELLKTNELLRREIAQRRLVEERLQSSLRKQERVLQQTGVALASAAEKRDPYIAGHQKRVAKLSAAIGAQMGLPEDRLRGVWVAGTLHDIGKLCVPAEILSKPGGLTDLEFTMIKSHTVAGYDILKGIDFSWPVADMVMQHHERLDGSGYPSGLAGEQILLEARVLAVADVVEAMCSHRPYRPAIGKDAALAEITGNVGTLYDGSVVEACSAVLQQGISFQ